jgi:HlyD family secretion protein
VVAGQAVLRVIEPSSLWVKVRLDQGRSAGLTAGLLAQVVLRSNPGQAIAGKVARVEAVSDSVTEERVAMVSLDQPPASLSVGELAEVTLTLPPTARAVLLPNAAIKRVQAQTGVWTVENGSLRFAPVRLGQASLGGQVQVLDGVKAGATVVVHSEKDIAAKTRITVVDSLAGRQP